LRKRRTSVIGSRWPLRGILPGLVFIAFLPVAGLATGSSSDVHVATDLPGVTLENGDLRVRVVGNDLRLNPLSDFVAPGYNGLASLIRTGQGRNVFNMAGLNFESCHTDPRAGLRKDVWNAPRVAPMAVRQRSANSVVLTQRAEDAAGLNIEVLFELGPSYVQQTITVWPDIDIQSSSTFWASYMNLVQNTSLYLLGSLNDSSKLTWLEATSAGHSGSGTFFRSCDPVGKTWSEFLTDNPVARQSVFQTPESLAATERAGFRVGDLKAFGGFFFGFVDDYVALWVFQKNADGEIRPWVSASGAESVRRPAWDFVINSGRQKAGERRTYRVRLVYKKFSGIEDVLEEVAHFQEASK